MPRTGWPRATLLAGFALAAAPLAAQGGRVERDVAYVPVGTPEQTLDLYVPAGRDFPTVLFIHGGSLVRGDTRASEFYARVCEPFVRSGVACATMDYRVAPEDTWPAMPNDVAAAVRWVHDSIAARGGDPGRVFLFGHSSGCLLAAVVGNNPAYLRQEGLDAGALAGIVPMGCTLAPSAPLLERARELGIGLDSLRRRWEAEPDPPYARLDDWLDADPSRFVGPTAPPALVVVAEHERFQPPVLEQAARFVVLMYEADRPADVVIVPGTHLGSIRALGEPGNPTFAAILRFIADPHAAGLGSRPSSVR